MSKRIYCDTNIFLDHLLDRKNKYGRNIGDSASSIFSRALKCEFFIVVSSWNLAELNRKIGFENISSLFQILERKIIKVQHNEEDIEEAKKINPEHFQDALHAILANKSKADFLITRNLPDFLQYSELIDSKLSEQI